MLRISITCKVNEKEPKPEQAITPPSPPSDEILEEAKLALEKTRLSVSKFRNGLVQEINKTVVARLNIVLALNGVGIASTVAVTKETLAVHHTYSGIPTCVALFFFLISSGLLVRANASYKSTLPCFSAEYYLEQMALCKKYPAQGERLSTAAEFSIVEQNTNELLAPTIIRLRLINYATGFWVVGVLSLVQIVVEWITKEVPFYTNLL